MGKGRELTRHLQKEGVPGGAGQDRAVRPCWGSEGGDVIQRIVQLLTDGLVLHLLGIDLVCSQRAGRVDVRQGVRDSQAVVREEEAEGEKSESERKEEGKGGLLRRGTDISP